MIVKDLKKIIIGVVACLMALSSCDSKVQQNCDYVDIQPFIGYYQVSEYCQQGFGHNITFATVNPGFGSSTNQIIFQNFINGQSMEAYVDCNGSYFRVPDQNLGSTAFTVVGEGNLIDNGGYIQLQFDLQIYEYGQSNYCSYIFSK